MDPKAALSEFVKHLQRELTRTDFDGVVLIFMYQEHLSAMVKAMNSVTSRKLRNDLGVIKG